MRPKLEILCGHALDVMRTMPDNSVHCVVTSPPYWGLRDYGTEPQIWGGRPDCEHEWGIWEEYHDEREKIIKGKSRTSDRSYGGDSTRRFSGNHQRHLAGTFCLHCGAWLGELGQEPDPMLYVAHIVEVFREIHRVLRPDGTVWLNIADCYAGAGDHRGGKGNEREQRKKISTPAAGIGLEPKNMVGIPWMLALAFQGRMVVPVDVLRSLIDGEHRDFLNDIVAYSLPKPFILRNDIIWEKKNVLPESVKDRPTRCHEYIFLFSKSQRYWYDADAIREPYVIDFLARTVRGHSSRHKYVDGPKNQTIFTDMSGECSLPLGRNARDVWAINTKPFSEAHFAVFPVDLAKRMILAGCPAKVCPKCGTPWEPDNTRPGCSCSLSDQSWVPGTVLDPFCGAGTVLLAAGELGRNAIGIEIKPEFVEMTRKRITAVSAQERFFV